jgi:hypothetical protein
MRIASSEWGAGRYLFTVQRKTVHAFLEESPVIHRFRAGRGGYGIAHRESDTY